MSLPALALAAQIILAPCTIEGVPGEARCGTYAVPENRDAKGGRQINLSIIVLYTPEGLAQAPKLVRQLLDGDERGLTETALSGRTLLGSDRLAAGFFLSVTCGDDVPFLAKDASAQVEGTFGGDYRLQQQTAACAVWPRGAVSSAHRQPTRSAIPTLIVSGELDPVTPPAGGPRK